MMNGTTMRRLACLALAASLGACTGAPAPAEVEGQSLALEGDAGGATYLDEDAGDDWVDEDGGIEVPVACTQDFLGRSPTACQTCAVVECGAEMSSCGTQCQGVLACIRDRCDGNASDFNCVILECGPCLAGDVTPISAAGACLSNQCTDVCGLVAAPEPAPLPPPSPFCQDTLGDAVGGACLACAAGECAPELAQCDGDCRSLLTCAMNACDGTGEVSCIVANCNSCLVNPGVAQETANCMMARCPDSCPPPGGGGYDDGDAGVGGDGDWDPIFDAGMGGAGGAMGTGGSPGGAGNGNGYDNGGDEPPTDDPGGVDGEEEPGGTVGILERIRDRIAQVRDGIRDSVQEQLARIRTRIAQLRDRFDR